MMDLIALGILIICFGCVKLFANFCESLINPKEKQEDIKMIVLGILVLLLAGYLVYALIQEKGQQQEEERCYRLYSHWQFS